MDMSDKTIIQYVTGTGLTITGTIGRNMEINSTSRITSTATYAKIFTFFIKAKRINTARNGRVFTSSTGNKLFGWWLGRRQGTLKGMFMEWLVIYKQITMK